MKGSDKSTKSTLFPPAPDFAPPLADRGEGIYILDTEGRRYIDGCGGAMTVSLGHSNQEILQGMKDQMDRITFTYRNQFYSEALETLCERLDKLAPGEGNKAAFSNSGSEATELALKMAYSYWRGQGKPLKQRIISRWSSYHGSTMGSLSMSGNVGRRKEYAPYLKDYPLLELPLCSHCPYEKTYPGCDIFCARYLEKMIHRIGSENIAAFIAEPITGASGAGITPPDEYFPIMERICRENDILLIFDEVITGIGRTGTFFACEHWNVKPDIICFGKGIASGYAPIAGILASERVASSVDAFSTGHTFSGNPLSAATANRVLDYMEKHEILEKVENMGIRLESSLKGLKAKYPDLVHEVRGKGLLWGLELRNKGEMFEPEKRAAAKLVEICFQNGLLVYPSAGYIDGFLGESILLSPPYIITDEEMDELIGILDLSLSAFN